MYIPEKYVERDVDELLRVVKEHQFALIITGSQHLTWAPVTVSHVGPNKQDIHVEFHLARPNPHVKALTDPNNKEETIIAFLGTHGYISPRWYKDQKNEVPTWNFTAFHLKGWPREVTDDARLKQLLNRLVEANEATLNPNGRWSMAGANPKYIELLSHGMVGFTMKVDSFEGKAKLSQDRPDDEREKVVRGLAEAGFTSLSQSMAQSLKRDQLKAKL